MATTTPKFGWTVPTSSDYVKDGATAIETLGDAIDASFGSGTIIQVVTGTTTTDTSSVSTTYADTTLTATITPRYTSSKILVIVNQVIRTNSVGAGSIRIMRGATVIWTPGQDFYIASDNDVRQVFSMTYLDSPATTSATVYKTQFNRSTGAVNVQPSTTRSQITLLEVSA